MGIFDLNISVINKFLGNFKELFSKKQFKVFVLAVYSLFKEYNRNCLQAMANKANCDYQTFQYFFSDAKWSLEKLNTKRLSSFNDYKRAIDSLLILSSSAVISKSGNFIYDLYGIKSQRFKNSINLAA